MKLAGIIIMAIGAILFYGFKIAYRRDRNKADSEFAVTMSNVILAMRTIGAIMVIAGGIIIIFVK